MEEPLNFWGSENGTPTRSFLSTLAFTRLAKP